MVEGGSSGSLSWDTEPCSGAVLFLPFLLCCLPSLLPKGKADELCPCPVPHIVPGLCPRVWQLSCGTPLLAVGEELPFLSLTYLLGSGLFTTSVKDPGVYSINGV